MSKIQSELIAYPYNTDDVTVWSGRDGELAFYAYDDMGRIEMYEWISAENPVSLRKWR